VKIRRKRKGTVVGDGFVSSGFGDGLRKLHGLKVEQDTPKNDGDLEGA